MAARSRTVDGDAGASTGRPGTADPAIAVRIAEPGDYPAIARLTVAAYQADGQLVGEAGRNYAKVLADVSARAGAGDLLVAVGCAAQRASRDGAGEPAEHRQDADRVLGSVLFVLPDTPYAELSRPGEAEFRMLAVDPAAQGRGVGQALVRACLDRACQRGVRAVVICTRSFSLPAQRLYARLGFIRVPDRDWSPERGVELLALRRDLTDWQPGGTAQSVPMRSSNS